MQRTFDRLESGLELEVRPVGPRARLSIQGKLPASLIRKLVESEGPDVDLRSLPPEAVTRILKVLGDAGVDQLMESSRDTRLELVCSCVRVKDGNGWIQLTPENMDQYLDWRDFVRVEELVKKRNQEVAEATAPLSQAGNNS